MWIGPLSLPPAPGASSSLSSSHLPVGGCCWPSEMDVGWGSCHPRVWPGLGLPALSLCPCAPLGAGSNPNCLLGREHRDPHTCTHRRRRWSSTPPGESEHLHQREQQACLPREKMWPNQTQAAVASLLLPPRSQDGLSTLLVKHGQPPPPSQPGTHMARRACGTGSVGPDVVGAERARAGRLRGVPP